MSVRQHDYNPVPPAPDNRSWLQKKRDGVAYWWLLLPCRLFGHRWRSTSTDNDRRRCERCGKSQWLRTEFFGPPEWVPSPLPSWLTQKRYDLAHWWRTLPCRLFGHHWVYTSTKDRYCERCNKSQWLKIESGWVP
jgi:hypothetical protein